MMMFTDNNGNPTGPPDGWTDTNSPTALSPVGGGPWGIPPLQSSNGNMNGLGLGQVGQSMRPPSFLGPTSQYQSAPPPPGWNDGAPKIENVAQHFADTYGGSNVASQIPNSNSLMGPPLGQQNAGQVGQSVSMPMPGGGMMSGLGNMQPMQMNPQMAQMNPQMAQMNPQVTQMSGGGEMLNLNGSHMSNSSHGESEGEGGGWWTKFSEALPGIGTGLAAGASIAGALKSAENTTATGHAMQDYLSSLGTSLNNGSQFQGYGVSTGMGPGSVKYNEEGQLITDLGLNEATQTEITNMKNASSGNFADAANAYNAMNMVNSGQSAADYNAASQTLQTGASGITPGQGAVGGQAGDAAMRAMADPSQRQGEIYQQLMAIQNPELNRQQAEQQAQEYARGRGGVRGSQYGGTAEDAAMARARANASNQASLNAMQQADSERSMFGQMASQFGQVGNQNYSNMANYKNQMNNSAAAFGGLGNQADSNAIQKMGMLGNMGNQLAQLGQQNYQNSYMPMQQQIEAMKLGMGNADMAQTGQLTGQDYMAQLGLGGANANINAQHSANQLTGNLYNALLANIGGTQGSDGSAGSGLMGLIGGGIEGIGKYFGWGD